MQDKLLVEFERIGVKAIKEGKTKMLDEYLNKVAEGEVE